MRRLIGLLVALVILVALYVGSALWSLAALANAVRAGDGAGVIARTDVPSVTQSIADQVVAAYLARIGETRQVGSSEKMLIRAAGSGVVQAMIAKMLTPEHLAQFLKTGQLEGVQDMPQITGLPRLADLETSDVTAMLRRFRFIEPMEFGFRVGGTAAADDLSEVRLRFVGTGWKLSGLTLPASVARDLAATLPAK